MNLNKFINQAHVLFTTIFAIPNQKHFMKNSKYTKFVVIIMVVLFIIVSMLSCTVHHPHSHSNNSSKRVPPGQAKKMSGSKSAKAYAPGQQKK